MDFNRMRQQKAFSFSMMRKGQVLGTEAEFVSFVDEITGGTFVGRISKVTGTDEVKISTLVNRYIGEMIFGYRFLKEHLPTGKLRILEIGAGLGLLSLFLQRLGHDVVALEPAGKSFDLFEQTKREIWEVVGETKLEILEAKAQELSVESHGTFDFSFSVNVMEHVDELPLALSRIISVMRPNSVSVHACPNYHVPYEPHFAIPLVPFKPDLSRRLYRSAVEEDPDLWATLNFISVHMVKRIIRDNGCTVSFRKGLLLESFKRLDCDPEFLARHKGGMAIQVLRLFKFFGLLNVLRFVPARYSTPMEFTISNGAASD